MGDEPQQETQDQQQGEQAQGQQQPRNPAGGEELAFADLKPGIAWGESITKRRADELEAFLQKWEVEKERSLRRGPFDRVELSGADVYWLAARALASGTDRRAMAVAAAACADAWATARSPDGARLYLSGLHLERASLNGAQLARATLNAARLEGASLQSAHLEFASLAGAHLEGANLYDAHLDQAYLRGAHLEGTDLRAAYFDAGTTLVDVSLDDGRGQGGPAVADVRWGAVNIGVTDWSRPHPGLHRWGIWRMEAIELGDEREAREATDKNGKAKDKEWRLKQHRNAVRANRQLAIALRTQGLNEDADRFAYKAQQLQRQVLRQQGRWDAAFGSWVLDRIAGYGYRPLRTLMWYVGVVGASALAYYLATHGALTFGLPPSRVQPLHWYEALVLSVSSFHGRGFFQPVQSLGDPVAILAAAEAVFGLFIEVSFIATFTQRYFGK